MFSDGKATSGLTGGAAIGSGFIVGLLWDWYRDHDWRGRTNFRGVRIWGGWRVPETIDHIALL